MRFQQVGAYLFLFLSLGHAAAISLDQAGPAAQFGQLEQTAKRDLTARNVDVQLERRLLTGNGGSQGNTGPSGPGGNGEEGPPGPPNSPTEGPISRVISHVESDI